MHPARRVAAVGHARLRTHRHRNCEDLPRTGAAKFLGYEITTQHSGTSGRKRINGSIALRVPTAVIKAKCAPYLERGKPAAHRALQNLGDYNIVAAYGAKYRGISQYYLLAGDVHKLSRLRWVMVTSLLKTLAAKHDSTVTKMAARYKAAIETPHGPRTCFEAVRIREGNQKPLVARFGGIPLKRQKTAVIVDRAPGRDPYPRKEIITRLQRNRCELCQHSGQVQVHHVARLADLAYPGHSQPVWARLMAAKRRKSLMVCPPCHDQIHAERPPAANTLTA